MTAVTARKRSNLFLNFGNRSQRASGPLKHEVVDVDVQLFGLEALLHLDLILDARRQGFAQTSWVVLGSL